MQNLTLERMSRGIKVFVILFLVMQACAPKEDIVFKGIKNVEVQVGSSNNPELLAKAYFHNPNAMGMKLKEIHVDVLVDGKLSAEVRQKMKLKISPRSDFMVPLAGNTFVERIRIAGYHQKPFRWEKIRSSIHWLCTSGGAWHNRKSSG
jgi:LEA14-like dessication related protein